MFSSSLSFLLLMSHCLVCITKYPRAKVVHQYALLGRYDFLTILEAPDNETVAKIMVELGSRGTLETTTLAAIEIDDFLNALK